MRMKIVVEEHGYQRAMTGLSLSHDQSVEKMPAVAYRLRGRDGGHNKFLESIIVWMDITGPLFWWKHFDTYRIGTVNIPDRFPVWLKFWVNLLLAKGWPTCMPVTKQAGSTMHNILKQPLVQADFSVDIYVQLLDRLNDLRERKEFLQLIAELPGAYLQRRVVVTNYSVLRYIFEQRRGHKLPEWEFFIQAVMDGVDHGELLE